MLELIPFLFLTETPLKKLAIRLLRVVDFCTCATTSKGGGGGDSDHDDYYGDDEKLV